jgi:hypothetical protein
MAEDKNLLDKIKDKARDVAEGLKAQYGIGSGQGNPWPQTQFVSGLELLYPKYKTRGWLPPTLIPVDNPQTIGQYSFTDWRGVKLKLEEINIQDKKDKFDEGLSIPNSNISNDIYSTRDMYLIFGDNSTDYFRHGLQIIDNLTPIEDDGSINLGLSNFKSTPFENSDPVIFGFEMIIDDISSPLLNGSILDFLNNYSSVNEIASKIPVYEDFKQQLVKFFKTKSTVRIDDSKVAMSKMRQSGYPEAENNKGIFQPGKKAYMNYYLKKISGLEKLIEANTPSTKKYLVDYNKDLMTLSFSEDVSLSLGTLAHLYKLLYWSKPNGKGIVPENLLRFNCDIVVSEVRNFKRVRKAIDSNNIEIIKDNVSRYVYSLRECQFYFNNMPHSNDIDMGGISPFGEGAYSVQFDYKYSTTKLERFVPTSDGFGQYVGYDGGAIWKIGNPGERESRGTQSGQLTDTSIPRFFSRSQNRLNQTGVDKPFILSKPEDNLIKDTYPTEQDEQTSAEESASGFEKFKKNSKAKAKELKGRLEDQAIKSVQRELQFAINTRVGLLNKTLNKIANSSGITGIRPPKNIYTDSVGTAGRVFYDVRGELLNFLGDSLGNTIGGTRNRSF